MDIDLKNLKVNGFHLSSSTTDKLNSIYYDSDNYPDDLYIVITSDTEDPDRTIVSIVQNCESVALTAFDDHNISYLETWLNSKTNSIKE